MHFRYSDDPLSQGFLYIGNPRFSNWAVNRGKNPTPIATSWFVYIH